MKWRINKMRKLVSARINFRYLMYTLNKNKGLLFLYGLLVGTAYPVAIFNSLRHSYSYHDNYSYLVGLLFVAVILSVVTPIIIFNYLSSKKAVDVYHSLPIRRRDLLVSNVVLAYLFVAIPTVLSFIIGQIVLVNATSVNFSWDVVFLFLRALVLLGSLQLQVTFVIMNTGALFDIVIHTFIFLIAPFVGYGAYSLFASTYIVGYYTSFETAFRYLSPISAQFTLFNENASMQDTVMLYWLVLAIIFAVLAVSFYDKRKSEESENPFVNRWYFPTIVSIFTGFLFVIFFIGLNYNYEFAPEISINNLFYPVLFTYAIYMVLDTARRRTFKLVMRSTLNYVIILAVTVVFLFLGYFISGLSYSWKTPQAANIGSVVLNTSADNHIIDLQAYSDLKFTSQESIDEILAVHQNIVTILRNNYEIISGNTANVESRFGYSIDDEYATITFKYTYTDGGTFNRSYYVPYALIYDLVNLLDNPEYYQVTQPILSDQSLRVSDIYLSDPLMMNYYVFNADREALKTAFFNDLAKLSVDDLLYEANELKYVLAYSFAQSSTSGQSNPSDVQYYPYQPVLFIDDRFTETIALLETRLIPTSSDLVTYIHLIEPNITSDDYYGRNYSSVIFHGVPAQNGYSIYYEASTKVSVPELEEQLSQLSPFISGLRFQKEAGYALILEPTRQSSYDYSYSYTVPLSEEGYQLLMDMMRQ